MFLIKNSFLIALLGFCLQTSAYSKHSSVGLEPDQRFYVEFISLQRGFREEGGIQYMWSKNPEFIIKTKFCSSKKETIPCVLVNSTVIYADASKDPFITIPIKQKVLVEAFNYSNLSNGHIEIKLYEYNKGFNDDLLVTKKLSFIELFKLFSQSMATTATTLSLNGEQSEGAWVRIGITPEPISPARILSKVSDSLSLAVTYSTSLSRQNLLKAAKELVVLGKMKKLNGATINVSNTFNYDFKSNTYDIPYRASSSEIYDFLSHIKEVLSLEKRVQKRIGVRPNKHPGITYAQYQTTLQNLKIIKRKISHRVKYFNIGKEFKYLKSNKQLFIPHGTSSKFLSYYFQHNFDAHKALKNELSSIGISISSWRDVTKGDQILAMPQTFFNEKPRRNSKIYFSKRWF